MPVPTFSSMADSQRRKSLSPRRGKPMLERSNAHKRISYRAPNNRDVEDSISEEDMMIYGAEDSPTIDQIRSMVGDWSLNPDDYYTRQSRCRSLSSPRAPSPPLSPALASPDSAKRFEFSPERSPGSPQVEGSFSFGRHRASDRFAAQTGESPVASTSYHPVAPTSRRPGVRSGELNPSWMTEGRGFIEVGQAHVVESPRTPASRVSWMSERLPDQEDTTAFLGQMGDASPDRNSYRLYTSISAPPQGVRVRSPISSSMSVARDIMLSPPRDSPYTRAISAPVESPEKQRISQHKGSQVQNEPWPQESPPLPPAVQSSHVGAPNNVLTKNAGSGGSDQSGSGSGTTDDGDSFSAGLEEEVVRSPSPTSEVPWKSWKKLHRLGAGSFGTVYGGVSNNGIYFAVKEVPLGSESVQSVTQLEQEIAILSKFQHENIVQYLGTERTDDTLYIFLELVTMGSLASLYNKHQLYAEQMQNYTRQILYGLKYLHEQEIVHRDVKCANILVNTNGTAKLADFGMAKQISKLEEVKSTKGSAQWMAPEVIDPRKKHHLPADIWSLGCTVLEMAIRGPPFGELEWGPVFWKVAHGEAPSIPDDFDEDMKDFIKQCLNVNPSKRPTAAELLLHPFVNGQQGVLPSPTSSFKATTRGGLQAIEEEHTTEGVPTRGSE